MDSYRPSKCNNDPLARMPIAMAYVPWQIWGPVYEPAKALKTGTIFPVLDKPFLGRRGNC